MPDIINLNRARKQKARADRKAEAAGNRVRFGRTRAEREAARAVAEKAGRDIDAHRIEPGDTAGKDHDR